MQELKRLVGENSSQIIKVTASAGSGKTWILSLRYIHLVLSDNITHNDPDNVLAITFTNDATKEMRRRIIEYLKKLYLEPDSEISKSIKEVVDTTNPSEKAAKMVDTIIRGMDKFRVSTIDSFIHTIIQASTYELGLPPEYTILKNTNEFFGLAFDNLLARVTKDESLRELFVSLIYSGLTKSFKPWEEIKSKLGKFFDKETTYTKEIDIPSSPDEEERQLLEEFKKECEVWFENLPENKKKLKTAREFVKDVNGKRSIRDVIEHFSGKKSVSPSRINYYDPFFEKNAEKILGRMAEFENRKRLSIYNEFYKLVKSEVERLKIKHRGIFLGELNKRINELLKESLPPWIYYKLGFTIYHYLIDEFQDTSELQWENIRPLIEESLSKGGTLFYVGDPKQLLYRFRGSSFKTFDRPQEDFSHFGLVPIELRKNWRSRREIVEFNNRIFSTENLVRFVERFTEKNAKDSITNIYDEKFKKDLENMLLERFKDAEQKFHEEKEGGYVKIRTVKKKGKRNEKEEFQKWLLEILEDVTRRYDYKDIAILVGKNKEVGEISAFLAERYPVSSFVSLDVRNHPVVRAIINLLSFLDYPPDNLSFYKFLKSDVFKEACIQRGLCDDNFDIDTWMLKNSSGSTPLYSDFRKSFKPIWDELFDEIFKKVGYYPPYDLVWQIIERFNIMERFPGSEAFVQKFLDRIYQMEEDGALSLKDILEIVKNQSEGFSLTQGEGINVKTIHKAKGLEFEVVIVASFHSFSQRENDKIDFVEDDENIRVFNNEKKYFLSRTIREYKQKADVESLIDRLNTFYVALTRAKSELYIFLNSDYLNLLFEDDDTEEEYGSPVEQKREMKEEPVPGEISYPLRDWHGLLANRFSEAGLKETVRRGDLIHRILSKIERLEHLPCSDMFENYMKEFIIDTQREIGYKADTEEIYQEFSKFFSDSRIVDLFSGDLIHNEKEIYDRDGNHLRIDKLVFKDNKIYVVEFKTGEEERAHVSQVRRYMRALEELHPEHEVYGYLVYFDGPLVKEVR